MALAKSVKPVVMVVRGPCVGISYTASAHATFMYCSPEAKYITPFMKLNLKPEGTSTLMFPRIFGRRLANEILLTDKMVKADLAAKSGFVNGIVDGFDKKSEWFNPDIIPVIPKLLNTDYKTLVNCMAQLNQSKDLAKIEEVTMRELKALVETYANPQFLESLKMYLEAVSGTNSKKEAKM